MDRGSGAAHKAVCQAEVVRCLEDVLAADERPYDSRRPVPCRDEQPVQLGKETCAHTVATARQGQRVDCECERAGTVAIVLFAQPLAGWRGIAVGERKTKVDWAIAMAPLREGRYAAMPPCRLREADPGV